MGTNYYLQHRINKDGRIRDMHICKTSSGWTPSLVGYNQKENTWHEFNITSWFDWKMFLAGRIKEFDGIIFDEYEEVVTFKDFVDKIEGWGKPPVVGKPFKNHAEEALRGNFGKMFYDDGRNEMEQLKKRYWVDPEGYSFHDGEFS